MLGAVGRLLPADSPSRFFRATHHLALRLEVDRMAAHDIALMEGTHRGRTVRWCTPGRKPGAAVM